MLFADQEAKPEVAPGERAAALPLAGLYVYANADVSCMSSKTISQRHADFLIRHGCERVSDPQKANILLVDTCGFSSNAEAASLDVIRATCNKARPGARVVVTGCLTAINPGSIEDEFASSIVSAHNEEQLAAIFSLQPEAGRSATVPARLVRRNPLSKFWQIPLWKQREVPRGLFFGAWLLVALFALDRIVPVRKIPLVRHFLTLGGEEPQNLVITISDGCVGNCTFCAIPLAKGRTRSAPLGAIIDEVRRAVSNGVRVITLTSEDTGAYGSDIGTSIVDLLDRLNALAGNFSINIDAFDPRWLRKYDQALIDVISKGRVARIQFPLQSSSNTVLARMARAYQMEQVLPVIHRLRRAAPDLVITTQFIAGFPGETAAEYAATKRVVESGLFDFSRAFAFSNRPNTKTLDMPDHLPEDVVFARAGELNAIVQRQLLRRILGKPKLPPIEELIPRSTAPAAAAPDAEPAAAPAAPKVIDLIAEFSGPPKVL